MSDDWWATPDKVQSVLREEIKIRDDLIATLTEQLEAARADAKEAEAYAEELEAKLAKAVELLKEARQDLEEYVTHEWPKDEHPVYERKWERDMELCRRIDTTLAEIEGEKG